MTNSNSTSQVPRLLDELDQLAHQLGDSRAHFTVGRASGGWDVTVFVRAINDPEVRILNSPGQDPYGVIRAASDELVDVLATAVRICESVARNEAVPA